MIPPTDRETTSVLRLLACGSVDDGKSTLIGHLLYNTGNVYSDQITMLESESRRIGNAAGQRDFSLLLDGLVSEREQGITIDVAHRYFNTARRKFVVVDSPGHEQYTRNMVTGASRCDAAIVLVDARLGVLPQTRRHALICALMGIRDVVFAVNKMDLVGWDRERFDEVRRGCLTIQDSLATLALAFGELNLVPVSALLGDNLTERSASMPWYTGVTIVDWIETVSPSRDRREKPFRFPVQYVIKPGSSLDKWQTEAASDGGADAMKNYRGYAGTIVAGSVKRGDPVVVLPSGRETTVERIVTPDGEAPAATAGTAVSLSLADQVDVSRGDGLFHPETRPEISDQFKVRMVWMQDEPLFAGRRYLFQSVFGSAVASVTHLGGKFDLSGYLKLAAESLQLNDVGEAEISVSRPIPFDAYGENRDTGGFILIDRVTNRTAACGMIMHSLRRAENVHWQALTVDRAARSRLMGQKQCVVWLTGLSGTGKSTIANLVENKLHVTGHHTMVLDGDNVRHGLNKDLGFTDADRIENIRRIGEVCKLMADAGLIVITAFISPYRADRQTVRDLFPEGEFLEVFVDTPLEVCEARDPKGLYKKARAGLIPNMTGVNAPYEVPERPEMVLRTVGAEAGDLADSVVAMLVSRGVVWLS